MFEQFAVSVDQSASGNGDAATASGPNPLHLIFTVLADRVRRIRLRRRRRS
jgi:hypothetical protein